jgi:hemerythrin
MSPEVTSTGNPTMDGEHRVQVGLIRALCDAVRSGSKDTEVGAILDQLTEYSSVHFMSEELLMRLASYDDYEDHVADHAQMLEVLTQMRTDFDAGKPEQLVISAEAGLVFMQRHIETRDARFAASANG